MRAACGQRQTPTLPLSVASVNLRSNHPPVLGRTTQNLRYLTWGAFRDLAGIIQQFQNGIPIEQRTLGCHFYELAGRQLQVSHGVSFTELSERVGDSGFACMASSAVRQMASARDSLDRAHPIFLSNNANSQAHTSATLSIFTR